MPFKSAYMAGIIDGEGCIRINNSARVHVTNTSLILINWLQENYPGYIWHQPKVYGHNWKPSHMWEVSGKNAVNLLFEIRPFLIIKKEQADVILNFYGNKYSRKKGLMELKPVLQQLTHKGVINNHASH